MNDLQALAAEARNVRQSLSTAATQALLSSNLSSTEALELLVGARQLPAESGAWQSLALILLHLHKGFEIREWVRSALEETPADAHSLWLLEHLADWLPGCLDEPFLARLSRRSRFLPEIIKLQERLMFARQQRCEAKMDKCLLAPVLGRQPRILVIHNIIDGQGDEMCRTYALLQSLLDGFPELEITLFTDRPYLYDHPRVRLNSIRETGRFIGALAQKCDGILNFFEPYLPSNNYNPELQSILQSYLETKPLPLFVWQRKGKNHFVFESVHLNGEECVTKFGVSKRLLPLNYEATMRLIQCLGLPLRIGEGQPEAGAIQASNEYPRLAAAWHELGSRLGASGCSKIAVFNHFGGHHAMKGFTSQSFERLAKVVAHLADEGYGVVLVPNGYGWGGKDAIAKALDCLDEPMRNRVVAAPTLSDAQENIRQLKYFVSWCDLLVTVEGWMMHLAYAMGKPFRLLMAPYSYDSQWHPHGRSANQACWMPKISGDARAYYWLLDGRSPETIPPPVHYPEKDLLHAYINLCAVPEPSSAPNLDYWMKSADKDIRGWVVSARGKIDPSKYRAELLDALDDANHQVRGTAAQALLKSGLDLSSELSAQWRLVLKAYEYVGKFQFARAGQLGLPALPALKACIQGDEDEVRREASLTLELVNEGKNHALSKEGVFAFDKRDTVVGAAIFYSGSWEPEETRWVKSILRHGDIAVDAGANLGWYTVVMARSVGSAGRVFAFEPEPTNFDLLSRNVELNGLFDRCSIFQLALSDREDTNLFELSPDNLGDHRIRSRSDYGAHDNFF